MKFAVRRAWIGLASVLCLGLAPWAKALPVSIDLTNLRAIQTYSKDKGDDQAYLLVNGVVAGKEMTERFPKDKPWTIGPKTPVGSMKEPITLWKGDLNDGEYALVTVVLVQGKQWDDPAVKEFADHLAASEKKARGDMKLSVPADIENLATTTLKSEVDLVKGAKKTISKDANTNHYGGLFNIIVWNHGDHIIKRLDPIGLTFGEHYGTDAKIYTKIKLTRTNVMVKDDATGEWSEQGIDPLSDDEKAIHVKMLETDAVKGRSPPKHTTDYLAEIVVKAKDNPQSWELGGDHPGPTPIHEYWDFAK